jgi:biopolymer transport protein ExbB
MGAILVTTLLLWTLLFERLVYLLWVFPRWADAKKRCQPGSHHPPNKRQAWSAHRILEARCSQASVHLRTNLPLLQALLTILPLLGLLGTVLGMMEVFLVLASPEGNGARTLAAGISQATLSTLGGLLSAIAAMPAVQGLERLAEKRRTGFEESMEISLAGGQP